MDVEVVPLNTLMWCHQRCWVGYIWSSLFLADMYILQDNGMYRYLDVKKNRWGSTHFLITFRCMAVLVLWWTGHKVLYISSCCIIRWGLHPHWVDWISNALSAVIPTFPDDIRQCNVMAAFLKNIWSRKMKSAFSESIWRCKIMPAFSVLTMRLDRNFEWRHTTIRLDHSLYQRYAMMQNDLSRARKDWMMHVEWFSAGTLCEIAFRESVKM